MYKVFVTFNLPVDDRTGLLHLLNSEWYFTLGKVLELTVKLLAATVLNTFELFVTYTPLVNG